MCGIAGVISQDERLAPLAHRMHETLGHRGPDGEGSETLGGVTLCHRRLSIIDLSDAAAQPMWSSSHEAVIVYNGEIYNFRELREECVRRGMAFRTSSDTEVVLNLYLLDGEKAFARLNGMFAFCLHDRRSGDSWLVRDPMGIKPLYWTAVGKGVAFASELGALIAARCVPFEIDREALQAYVQLDVVPAPMSIIRGVQKLPGGSLLRIAANGLVTQQRYSRLAVEESAPAPDAAGDVERFDALVRAAVERHLVADVPVGVFLSGGIDSSIVARVAASVAGRVSTYSIAFDDPSFDESNWSSAVAKLIGSDHHVERLTAAAMLDLAPEAARVTSEPLADGSIFPTLLLSRFTRGDVKVALSGDGADELFAGYPTHRMIRAGRAFAVFPRPVRRLISTGLHAALPVSHDNLSLDFRIKKFVDGADRDPVLQNERWLGSFAPEELGNLLTTFDRGAQDRLLLAFHEPGAGIDDPLERVLRTDRRFYLQDGVLVKVDRASMNSSLEVRVPMLDHDVVRFANGLPADRKLRHGESKWLLRQWAKRHFPDEIWKRPKKGFGVPLARWFRGELRGLLHDTLSPASVARDGFFQPAAVERLLQAHDQGRRDERKRLFNLLTFTLWYRHFRGDRR